MPFGSEPQEPGMALAMSGGGYRAALFHVGAMVRLNDWGGLTQHMRIASASGACIASRVLARRWPHLTVDPAGGSPICSLFSSTRCVSFAASTPAWPPNFH